MTLLFRVLSWFLVLSLPVSCNSGFRGNRVPDPAADFPDDSDLIVEGVGAAGVKLGDSRERVIKKLGKPDRIRGDIDCWTNYYMGQEMPSLMRHLLKEEYRPVTLLRQKKKAIGIEGRWNSSFVRLRYHRENHFIIQPFFSFQYIYYRKGITVAFDPYSRVVEITLLTCRDRLHFIDSETRKKVQCRFRPFRGRLYKLGVRTDALHGHIYSGKDRFGFRVTRRPVEDTVFFFDRPSGKLVAVSLISPMSGGTSATIAYENHYHDVFNSITGWRAGHPNQYIRLAKVARKKGHTR